MQAAGVTGRDGYVAAFEAAADVFRALGVVQQVSGDAPPTPSGTIYFDTRLGGAQSYQAMSSLNQMLSLYAPEYATYGGSSFFYIANIDGNGAKALGRQWVPYSSSSGEQACMVSRPSSGGFGISGEWIHRYKMILGRTATSGGNGTIGAFTLASIGNAHQKTILYGRQPVGNGTDRLYQVMRPGGTKFSIDNRNYNSPDWSLNPYNFPGQILEITTHVMPSIGKIRTWMRVGNAAPVKVLDTPNGQNIGTLGLGWIQETVTTFPAINCVQAIWDQVVWVP